jgi:alcohol dehydrogenase
LCGGICRTDIELLRGYYDFRGVPGHEFVGVVEEAENPALISRRVVSEINFSCGKCEWCAGGLGRHCPARTVLGIRRFPGAFREWIDLPEKNLHPVPDDVSTDQAVFTEPVAAACEVLDQVEIPPGEETAVLGDGKLGLLIAQVLKAHGVNVKLYGRHRHKLQIAEAAGIAAELIGRKLPLGRFGFVVEATGAMEGLTSAICMARSRGTVIMKSTVHGKVAIDAAAAVVNEISLIGSRCGRFGPALRLLQEGKLNLEPMIADRYPLAEAPRAFARSRDRGVLKVLLDA